MSSVRQLVCPYDGKNCDPICGVKCLRREGLYKGRFSNISPEETQRMADNFAAKKKAIFEDFDASYLFCRECDKYVGDDFNFRTQFRNMKNIDYMGRYAEIEFVATACCDKCESTLIRKFVEVNVTVDK